MAEIKVATDATFEALVLNNDKPVVVDFWAAWCGPCKMVAPEMEKLAAKYEGQVDVVKVDVDANPRLSQAFNIMSIPTIAFFKPGQQPHGRRRLPAARAARVPVRARRVRRAEGQRLVIPRSSSRTTPVISAGVVSCPGAGAATYPADSATAVERVVERLLEPRALEHVARRQRLRRPDPPAAQRQRRLLPEDEPDQPGGRREPDRSMERRPQGSDELGLHADIRRRQVDRPVDVRRRRAPEVEPDDVVDVDPARPLATGAQATTDEQADWQRLHRE